MAQTTRKPKKAQRTPPPANDATEGNLKKNEPNKIVGLNLSISAELRREFKTFASSKDLSMAELFGRLFELHKAQV